MSKIITSITIISLFLLITVGVNAQTWRQFSMPQVDHFINHLAEKSIIYVANTGSDEMGNGTEARPYLTIQKGIDEAVVGDTVQVVSGKYEGPGNFNLDFQGKAITVMSESRNPEFCIIDCQNSGRAFIFQNREGPDSILDGFTIINGNAPTSEEEDNDRGGGIYCRDSAPVITNTIIMNGTARIGGGIYCVRSFATINNTTITENTSMSGGGIFCIYSSLTITNTTIAGNNGNGIQSKGSSVKVTNTILWGNTPREIDAYASSDLAISYSDIQGGFAGTGNIDMNPLFIDADNNDYHLSAISPCIDAGTSVGAPATDTKGNPRGTRPDMGAYEIWEGSRALMEAKEGSYIHLSDRMASLYVPPNSLPKDTIITINPVSEAELPFQYNPDKLIVTYDLEPSDLRFERGKTRNPATLTISYEGVIIPAGKRMIIFKWDGDQWKVLGGMVNGDETISIAIDQLGRFALMAVDIPSPDSNAKIRSLTSQPRAFSPNGNIYSTTTTISFILDKPSNVTVKIYNVAGRLVKLIAHEKLLDEGMNAFTWDGKDDDNEEVPTGPYIITVSTQTQTETKIVSVYNR